MTTKDLETTALAQINATEQKAKQLIQTGELVLPSDYSIGNALQGAYLVLQELENKDHKRALEVCTDNSIRNALWRMVTQGLSVDKSQGYFIVYGNHLIFQRSYFGSVALAKRVDPTIADVKAAVVYDSDPFEFEIVDGDIVIAKHKQTLEGIQAGRIKAAYASIVGEDGVIKNTILMTMDEIKQSWKQSKMSPVLDTGEIKASSTHNKFTAEMVKRTIINKICKPIINTSSDRHLLAAIEAAEQDATADLVEEEIKKNANKEVIDIPKGNDESPPEDNCPKDVPTPTGPENDIPAGQLEPEFTEAELANLETFKQVIKMHSEAGDVKKAKPTIKKYADKCTDKVKEEVNRLYIEARDANKNSGK